MLTLNNDSETSSDCYFITSGEDRSLRIHCVSSTSESTVQTIALPCQTLWYTICLPNGNLVVACSDGSIRLFTQNEKLIATKSEIDEYERELAQFTIPLKANEAMAQINRTQLPGIEALTIHGQKDGQTLMINNGSEVEVYQWDKADTKWVKIGVAVGSSDGGGGSSGTRQKTSYLGKVCFFTNS
jgi:phospholipase A-2-activating protein